MPISRPPIVDDSGSGIDGTIFDNAFWQDVFDRIDTALADSAVLPPGGIIPYGGLTAPSGFLLCNGSNYSRTGEDYLLLHSAIGQIYNDSFTADYTTDTINCTAHPFSNDDTVTLWSEDNDLPAGLDDETIYYVVQKATDSFKLSLTQGGGAVDFTDNGSGYMTVALSTTFKVPDLRGRSPLGAGQGSGLSDRAMGSQSGEENHVLTIAELASHTHTVNTRAAIPASSTTGTPGFWQNTTGVATGGAGSDTAHNTMHPYQVTNFIIKL